MHTAKATERRRYKRVNVSWPVVIMTTNGATVGETINVSTHGAFVSCRVALSPKEQLKLFIMPPTRQAIQVTAEVAWSNPHSSEQDSPPCGLGVQFRKIARADRRFLRDTVAAHAGKQRKSRAKIKEKSSQDQSKASPGHR